MARFNIKIENIVASTSLGVRVPLGKVVKRLKGTEYEPEQFPGLVYRLKDPKAAALIFSSGKIVCTGARSIKDVEKVINTVVRMLKKAGVEEPKEYSIQVENIVASAKLPSRLNLDKIAFGLEQSEYEPEQFPGLVYRMKNPKVAFLLFSSGKIVCTGLRRIKDLEKSVDKIIKKLKSVDELKE